MGRRSTLDIAKNQVENFFRSKEPFACTTSELREILEENKKIWKLAKSTTFDRFLSFIINNSIVRNTVVKFPSRTYKVYNSVTCHPLVIIQKIESKAYFSHFTAVSIHELTSQSPKTFYFKLESQPPPKSNILAQTRIDNAFKGSPRLSNRIAEVGKYKINMLSGAMTKDLGIETVLVDSNNAIRITSIERTLIDIVTRPYYAGGVGEVLGAYTKAAGTFSTNKLKATLKKMNLTYPYHQAIGFYLEKSGMYSDNQLAIFDSIPKNYDFYLTYKMDKPQYSQRWRLYYPSGF